MNVPLQPKPEAKKPYAPPQLVCHGDVRSLTQAGSKGYKEFEFIMVSTDWRV